MLHRRIRHVRFEQHLRVDSANADFARVRDNRVAQQFMRLLVTVRAHVQRRQQRHGAAFRRIDRERFARGHFGSVTVA